MRFLFVLFEMVENRQPHYNIAIGALSAALKQAGHETGLLHYTRPITDGRFLADVGLASPDMVGFSATTHMFPHVQRCAAALRQHTRLLTICGGVHPTLAPDQVIQCEGIDLVCVGEGDLPLVELCNRKGSEREISSIPGIWAKMEGQILRNAPGPPVVDLDTLALQDRWVFDYENLAETRNRAARVMASRGCPYSCSYCCNGPVSRTYPSGGKYVRFRSVDHVLDEIRELKRRFPQLEYLLFHDDILPLKRDWFRQFAERYPREVGLPFRCNCRPDLIDRETVTLLREAGCVRIHLGVESGNPRIRQQVLKRCLSDEQLIEAFTLCRDAGLQTQAFNMIGLPFEDPPALLDTFRLNAKLKPQIIWHTVFYPYPGTELHDLCQQHQWISDRRQDHFMEGSVLNHPLMTEEQINFIHEYFYPLMKMFLLLHPLPTPVVALAESLLLTLLSNPSVPRGAMIRWKRRTMDRVRKQLLLPLRRHAPFLYQLIRRAKDGRHQVFED